MPKQFWVIGAEYSDLQFTEPLDGTTRLFGPFTSYQDASQTWRERVSLSRHEARTRYTIVSNIGAVAAQQPQP
jgi:hypothetical protein